MEIRYREFYDFPRMFIVREGGRSYLFDGSFDDQLDDYPPEYDVYLMPDMRPEDLAGSWAHLAQRAIRHVGRIATSAVVFDPTRRRYIDGEVLSRVGMGQNRGRAV